MTESIEDQRAYPGRRAFARGAAGLAGAMALTGTVPTGNAVGAVRCPSAAEAGRVPFHGPHQAGIITRQQPFGGFAAFDVLARDRAELVELFRRLTVRCRTLTAGVTPLDPDVAAVPGPEDRLTITVGVGASLFDGRYGLAHARPPGLVPMPAFRETGSTRDGATVISRCRSAPSTRTPSSMSSGTWPGRARDFSGPGGGPTVSSTRRVPRVRPDRSSASRTAPRTRTPPRRGRWTGWYGSGRRGRDGREAAATRCCAPSDCAPRHGTGSPSASRSRSSAAGNRPGPRSTAARRATCPTTGGTRRAGHPAGLAHPPGQPADTGQRGLGPAATQLQHRPRPSAGRHP